MQPYIREPEYLTRMRDGTVKQLNPFSGTEVWTVARRGSRPLASALPEPVALAAADDGRHCVFCERRYRQTPPEKARLVIRDGRWLTELRPPADRLDEPAEFRRIPNLFEILSLEYWQANYGYELPAVVRTHQAAYLASPGGREHVAAVVAAKLRASGLGEDEAAAQAQTELETIAAGLFGGGHDVVVARRHFIPGAVDSSQLASAGTLSLEEHEQFIDFTIAAAADLVELNRYARYVAVFQNWLRPAGASIDHLHKQLVAIDERGVQHELTTQRLRERPNIFNEAAANYAAQHNLVIAENDHALAFAGFGHRYPTVEIYSKAQACAPWEHSPAEVRAMSDLLHAIHVATGPAIPTNEEWHYRPVDLDLPMPWRVVLKWRVSTLAGFEGATKIYLNTIDPYGLRDRLVPALFEARAAGRIAPGTRIATECACRPNPLRYVAAA